MGRVGQRREGWGRDKKGGAERSMRIRVWKAQAFRALQNKVQQSTLVEGTLVSSTRVEMSGMNSSLTKTLYECAVCVCARVCACVRVRALHSLEREI